MDAASLLPVIALDVKDGDVVGDLCAAPGGKTLALLFTKKPQLVVATDKSNGRMQRFKEVMFSYLPKEVVLQDSPDNRVQFLVRDAHTWRPEGYLFDKGKELKSPRPVSKETRFNHALHRQASNVSATYVCSPYITLSNNSSF